MTTIKKFEELEIWQQARILSQQIILISRETELKSDFKLRDQIKASAGSVMDNIAEGFERNGKLEFRQFYQLQKVQQARRGHNFIGFLIMNTLTKKS